MEGELLVVLELLAAVAARDLLRRLRDALDLTMTCMQTMMDANLALQIRTAQATSYKLQATSYQLQATSYRH